MAKKLMVIDTDCGVDDALAILLAFSCRDACDVIAITCCTGNTPLENVCSNVMRLTNYCNVKQIPVYRGCSRSVLDDPLGAHITFHGEDGFGSVSSMYGTGEQVVQPEHASLALVRLAREHKGQLNLVALGPLTNLALAKRLDDSFDENLKELTIMGGNIDGLGNATVSAEFNFAYDPESAYVVTNEFRCHMTIFPWETCIRFFMSWEFYEAWANSNHPIGSIIGRLSAKAIQNIKEHKTRNGYHCPDLMAMATFLESSTVRALESDCPVTVELAGRNTRGQMVVDRRSLNRRGKARGNIDIVTELHMDKVCELLMKMVSN